jgi:precorrin-6B methylase 1
MKPETKPETVLTKREYVSETKRVYIYTNHDATNKILRERLEQLGYTVSVLQQDRSMPAHIDVTLNTEPSSTVFAVMPIPSLI